MRHLALLLLSAMVLFGGCRQQTEAKQSGSIILELSISQASLNQGQVVLRSMLINGTNSIVSFLPWGTSLDTGVNGVFLVITHIDSGKELAYQGRMIKRRGPSASDYLDLMPLDSITKELDLSRSYNFCANSRYILTFSGEFISSSFVALPVQAPSIEFVTSDLFPSCL